MFLFACRRRRHAAAVGSSRGDLAGAAATSDTAAAGDASRAVLSGAATAGDVADDGDSADGEGASARWAVLVGRVLHVRRQRLRWHLVGQGLKGLKSDSSRRLRGVRRWWGQTGNALKKWKNL